MVTTKIHGVLSPTAKKRPRIEEGMHGKPHQQQAGVDQEKQMEQQVQPQAEEQTSQSSRAHGDVISTADGVRSSAIETDLTEDTVAMTTDTCAEVELDGSQLLAGFRKRWTERRGTISEASQMSEFRFRDESMFGDALDDVETIATHVLNEPVPIADDEVCASVPFEVDDVAISDDEPQLKQDVDALKLPPVVHEAVRSTNMSVFKFPWEKGPLASVFGKDQLVKSLELNLKPGGRNFVSMHLEVSEGSSMSARVKMKSMAVGTTGFARFVRQGGDLSASDSRERQRAKAVADWWKLLKTDRDANVVGQKVLKEASWLNEDSYAEQILDATFAVKAPGTINKRLYAMQAYAVWCQDVLGKCWQPLEETDAWRYVLHLKDSHAPATKATTFLEGVRFSWHLLGVKGADFTERSLRVRGVAVQQKAQKKPWRPADTLRVEEVRALHVILQSPDADKCDKLMSGHFLHMLYSRSRWSDLTQVEKVYVDDCWSYLEASTRAHKGAKSAELKSRLLPLVAACKGVTGECWAKTYLEVRKSVGLELPGEKAGPMIPAPADAEMQAWTQRPLSSEEGADYLRHLLAAPKTEHRRVSTHSLKSTAMSWASKFGVSEQHRAVLARHVGTVTTATSVYSRDLLSPVLREFDMMLVAIKTGDFKPDASRSGMLTPSFVRTAACTPGTPGFLGVPFTPMPPTPGQDAVHINSTDFFEQKLVEEAKEDARRQALEAEDGSPIVIMDDGYDPMQDLLDGKSVKEEVESSETSESQSAESTTDSDEVAEDKLIDAASQGEEPERSYYLNSKSQVLHAAKNGQAFCCGRKITATYCKVRELNGIRCSRCFNV